MVEGQAQPSQTPQQNDQVGGAGSVLSKLVDIRLVGKPAMYSGREEDWLYWRFDFMNWLLMIDDRYEDVMVAAERLQTTVPTQSGAELHNGFVAWRCLTAEFEPRILKRRLDWLSDLMSPSFDEAKFTEQFLGWRLFSRQCQRSFDNIFSSTRRQCRRTSAGCVRKS